MPPSKLVFFPHDRRWAPHHWRHSSRGNALKGSQAPFNMESLRLNETQGLNNSAFQAILGSLKGKAWIMSAGRCQGQGQGLSLEEPSFTCVLPSCWLTSLPSLVDYASTQVQQRLTNWPFQTHSLVKRATTHALMEEKDIKNQPLESQIWVKLAPEVF